MLKIITTVREETESIRVHLYGQFTGEYVPEVEKVLTGQDKCPREVVLDLANVTRYCTTVESTSNSYSALLIAE